MTNRDIRVVVITVVAAAAVLLVVLTMFGYWGFAERARHTEPATASASPTSR
jgi:hypothetical protein